MTRFRHGMSHTHAHVCKRSQPSTITGEVRALEHIIWKQATRLLFLSALLERGRRSSSRHTGHAVAGINATLSADGRMLTALLFSAVLLNYQGRYVRIQIRKSIVTKGGNNIC